MPTTKTSYRIVIASPNDVAEEVEIAKKYISKINNVDKTNNIGFDFYHWSIDSYAAFHTEGPQGQIDQQLKISDSDIFIGIFNRRIGTQALGEVSGTIHELNQAIHAWEQIGTPEIKLFFKKNLQSEKDSLSDAEKKQYILLQDFQERVLKKGIVRFFKTAAEFYDIISEELYRYRVTKIPNDLTLVKSTIIENTKNINFKEVISHTYTPFDTPHDLEITEYLSFILRVQVTQKGQISRFYLQFTTNHNEKKWIGFTNLFPAEFISDNESTEGIDFRKRSGYFLTEHILNVISVLKTKIIVL